MGSWMLIIVLCKKRTANKSEVIYMNKIILFFLEQSSLYGSSCYLERQQLGERRNWCKNKYLRSN